MAFLEQNEPITEKTQILIELQNQIIDSLVLINQLKDELKEEKYSRQFEFDEWTKSSDTSPENFVVLNQNIAKRIEKIEELEKKIKNLELNVKTMSETFNWLAQIDC